LADAHYYMPCSNAAKTRKQLKFGGVPQTNEMISAAGGPKFTILWGHLEDILLLNTLFSEDIARQNCAMVPRLAIFEGIFGSCADQISDLHSKFTLRPHHVWKYGRHPISDH